MENIIRLGKATELFIGISALALTVFIMSIMTNAWANASYNSGTNSTISVESARPI